MVFCHCEGVADTKSEIFYAVCDSRDKSQEDG
jgi:hypothetical protein